MINPKALFTNGVTIKTKDLTGILIPGIAINLYLFTFALGTPLETLTTGFGETTKNTYTALTLAIIASAILTGEIIDRKGKSQTQTRNGLLSIAATSILSLTPNITQYILPYAAIVGAATGISITALRIHLSEQTAIEERGRIAGTLILLSFLIIAIWKHLLKNTSPQAQTLLITLICLTAATIKPLETKKHKPKEKIKRMGKTTENLFLTWLLYTTAYGIYSSFVTPHPITKITNMTTTSLEITMILGIAVTAISGGTIIDYAGRKITSGAAILILAAAYTLYALNSVLAPIALILEITSIGFMTTIFIYVIWADISKNRKGLYLGSALAAFYGAILWAEALRTYLGPRSTTLAALLSGTILLMSIAPLYYTIEPLPKEKIRLRNLQSYIKDIKKIRI